MVSIIIPCYNVKDTLVSTVNSVLNQNNPDWEVIAIDDGSSDSTLFLLRQLQSNDSRIHVIHQENKGVSAARNNGIRHASGDWIYFLDADDLIEESLVSTINLQNDDTEMIVFDFIEKTKKKTRIHKIGNLETLFSDYLVNKQTVHISSIAVKSHLISSNNIYFDENTYYGEDREFVAKLFALRPMIRHIDRLLFTYMFRIGSAMTKRTYSERRFSSVLASERTYQSLKGTAEEVGAHINLAFTVVRHLKMFYDYGCKDDDLLAMLWQYVDTYVKTLNCHGYSKVEIYTNIARVVSYYRFLFRLFLKIC